MIFLCIRVNDAGFCFYPDGNLVRALCVIPKVRLHQSPVAMKEIPQRKAYIFYTHPRVKEVLLSQQLQPRLYVERPTVWCSVAVSPLRFIALQLAQQLNHFLPYFSNSFYTISPVTCFID